MAATVSGYQTVVNDISPIYTAAKLNTIYQTAPQNLTYADFLFLKGACASRQGAEEKAFILGNLTT
jgi:hypothetical protein